MLIQQQALQFWKITLKPGHLCKPQRVATVLSVSCLSQNVIIWVINAFFVQLLIDPLLAKGKKTKGMFDSFHWYLSRLCNNLSIKCLDLQLYLESIPKYSIQQYTIIPKFKINSILDNSLGISTKWKQRFASSLLEIKITCKLQHLVVWITFNSWYYGVILYISLDSLFI